MMLASSRLETTADGVLLFAVGLFSFVVGIGLFMLSSWARKAAIAGYILNGVMGLADTNIIALVIASLILTYLFSQGVKDVFSKSGQEQRATEFIKQEDKGIETMNPHQEIG
jgi:hypothetical protein